MYNYAMVKSDQTLLLRTSKKRGFSPLDDFARNEDGSLYTYYLLDGSGKPDLAKEKIDIDKATIINTKEAIEKAIKTMRAVADGFAYDGNEPSQARMDRAIQTLVGDEPITWRMYDNSDEVVTQTELGKALRASGILMSKLWFCKSIEEVETIVSNDTIWMDKYKSN